ncbi:hypothetical protein Pint_23578 [Pistacia integerrima]|uniref:Uncharacterized protein n=1 Tax=Pistacia integerrima TaxID=434235 RepID=A0ACC0YI54_9ROSI|nr:hypothetical protein Pint_23578 [Pistacia integerrima]
MDCSSQLVEEGVSLNEWEQIQLPSLSNNTPPLPTTPSSEWDMVAIRDNYLQDSLSFFPPNQHEGLPVPPQVEEEPNSPSGSSPSSTVSSSSAELRPRNVNDIWRVLSLRSTVLCSGIVRIAAKVRYRAVNLVGFRSFLSVTGVIAAVLLSLLYARMRRWRSRVQEENNRLILLVKEKDQKIGQLLIQVAQMNELLSARVKVPVIRIR